MTESGPRRRPMRRIGDLIPDAARALGLEDEFLSVATEELTLSKRALGKLRKDAARLDDPAGAPPPATEA